jgi:hypothetical protein
MVEAILDQTFRARQALFLANWPSEASPMTYF